MKVFILTALAFLLGIDDVSTKMFRRPLLIAPIVGLILGNLQALRLKLCGWALVMSVHIWHQT